jgi:RHS repeat-associated protein
MLMPGRSYSSAEYRYGFNGKEKDDEVKGGGNQQDYGFRIHDPRLGKFLSVDPLTQQYPELTPYQFASNTPIQAIDLDGLEAFGNRPCGWCGSGGGGGGGPMFRFSNPRAVPSNVSRPPSVSNTPPPANTPGQVKTGSVNTQQPRVRLSQAQGDAAEVKVYNDIKSDGNNAIVERNVTMRPEGTDKTFNTKVDVFQQTNKGSNINNEVKTGNSKLRPNQEIAKDHIENGSGKFELRTDKLKEYGYPKGSVIKMDEFKLLRDGPGQSQTTSEGL